MPTNCLTLQLIKIMQKSVKQGNSVVYFIHLFLLKTYILPPTIVQISGSIPFWLEIPQN